jgi:hypothetical protein
VEISPVLVSCCPSYEVHDLRNRTVYPILITSFITWSLFYVPTVGSDFPSSRILYKTTCVLDMRYKTLINTPTNAQLILIYND